MIGALLRRLLSESILFEHDPEEVYFWLSSLPIGTPSRGTGTPDEAPLLEEQTAVISFLDDCIQLGLKMPYGYIEEITVLSRGSTVNNYQDGGNASSPLLATIMEQVFARVSANLLCPLDVLAIVSFVRKLLVRLSGKQGSMMLLVQLSERLSSLPFDNSGSTEVHVISRRAVAREIIALKNYLILLRDPNSLTSPLGSSSSSVTDYLDRIENMSIRTKQLFLSSAYYLLTQCC